MKKIISIAFLMCTIFLGNVAGQQISAEAYNKDVVHEDFNQIRDIFKIVTTTDNYFILDNGDYLLSRNNNESEYAIIAKNSSVSDFVLKTAVRLGPSNNKRASIGIILKAQQDGKGAIIFEINKKGQYRIKQLKGNTYSTLSGNKRNNGWVKNKNVNGVDEHNFIEIRSENNIYDVHVNNNYLTTFFIPDYTAGACGLIISPATKARVSYYYINSKGGSNVVASYVNENSKDQSELVEELNKKIKILEKNNAQLNELNNEARGNQEETISSLTNQNTDLAASTQQLEQEIAALNRSITDLKNSNTTFEGLEEKYNASIANINGLTTELDKAKQSNAILLAIESELSAKNTELEATTKQQEKEIAVLGSANSDLKNSNTTADAKTKQLNKQIAAIKQQLSTQQAINTELSKDLNKSSSANTTASTKLNKEISSLQAKIASLIKSKNALAGQLTSVKNTHSKTKAGLSKAVTNKTTEIKALAAQLSKLNTELSMLRKTQAAHNAVTNSLKNDNATLNATIDNLNAELTSLKEELSELKTTNTDLKELFILKDFEVSGVKPSDLIEITTSFPTPEELVGNEKIYAVQFGVYMTIQPYVNLKGLDEVWYETTKHGTYVYLSGQFKSPQEATAHKNTLVALGYPNAFVVTLSK
jgi:myosin heavy subunit